MKRRLFLSMHIIIEDSDIISQEISRDLCCERFTPKSFDVEIVSFGEKWTPKIGQCYKVESGLTKRIPEDGQTT